jgi:hypothetical protein
MRAGLLPAGISPSELPRSARQLKESAPQNGVSQSETPQNQNALRFGSASLRFFELGVLLRKTPRVYARRPPAGRDFTLSAAPFRGSFPAA